MLLGASCSRFQNRPSQATHGIDVIDVEKTPAFVSPDEHSQGLWNSTKQVYTLRQFQPAWSVPSADAALQTLENASAEGLHPEDFGMAELRAMQRSLTASASAETHHEFDRRLTYSLVRYVSQLCFGRIDPRAVNPDWPAADKKCDVPQIVSDALEKNTVDKLAEELSPKIPQYQGLRAGLKHYRDIAAKGGWQPLQTPAGKARKAPANSPLANNLAVTGDLKENNTTDTVSQNSVDEALRHFQTRHGIEPDARLGKQTVAAMNVPVEQRIEQIEINMDRMRWITDRLEPRHIRVNIPGFHLSVHDGEQIPLEMRAIVGAKDDPTPVLDSAIEHVVFSPYWNVPLSIATKELLPKIQKDPRYLQRENIEVVRGSGEKMQIVDSSKINWKKLDNLESYHLRQKPGAANALGLVKFIFPNPHSVYLHDTPSENLFDRLTRTLSHGCVRVEKPADLAAYILQDQPEWNAQLIDEAMHAEKEKWVQLKTPLPIHLLYWTAWADADGTIQFREDVYGFDEKHRELTRADSSELPAAHASDIDVHEVGAGIVTDAASFHRQRGLSK
jgi:murein L,D-transpeptidase YcbB/YkuD